MYDTVHEYAPPSPLGRTLVAVVAAFVGVPVLLLSLFGLTGSGGVTAILLLLPALLSLTVATHLTMGVVRQAAAAPEAAPGEQTDADQSVETPVETLRRRYAEGELNDAEFERRLDALLETEGETTTDSEREMAVER
ncbi:SHOCT domain-containing protein [Halolamina sp. CBA1230]|uniref:SHOCT domain-containing protein n=1 Tax=Halolamina sp. CBA1230 TaxID=1853690 RepID=UPI001593752A|nr:SHOCT domain-containing protein [Halolamina sp. CBA1230]QKY21426.1 SHOCT domain-containing protein [Halolamina sp. CBA1230]